MLSLLIPLRLRPRRRGSTVRAMSSARVEVTGGPDAGLVVEFPLGRRIVVGRGDDADVRLGDAAASRRHCALEHRLVGVEVEDLGSASGTYLGAERVRGRALVG